MNRPDNPSPNTLNPGNPNALLEQVRTVIRLKHLSLRTEDSYLSTIRRFIFHSRFMMSLSFSLPEVGRACFGIGRAAERLPELGGVGECADDPVLVRRVRVGR